MAAAAAKQMMFRRVGESFVDSFRGVDGLDSPLTKSSKVGSFGAPNFLRGGGPKMFYGSLLPWFTSNLWLSSEG